MIEKMQIIIPMTGSGTRFREAGYSRLKPFIEIHNKPIIEWVVEMFKGDDKENIVFICRREHLQTLDYVKKELLRIAPESTIFCIEEWENKGPAFDILKAAEVIKDNLPIIVSYCDYYMHWDYADFKKNIAIRKCDGSIPCYTGFHPNLIPEKNLYGTCKVDKKNNLIEIREKFSWHEDKTKDLHSPGVFYFKSGEILKKYCHEMIHAKEEINGEFYMSLPFNYLVKDGLEVWCPSNVVQFCQWGYPEDLEDYLLWINSIRKNKRVE